MKSHLVFQLFATLALCGLVLPTARAELSDTQYAILSSVLTHGLGEACSTLVIEDKTTPGSFSLSTPHTSLATVAEIIGVAPEMLEDWQRANADFEFLSENFTIACDYELITTQERDALFAASEDNRPEKNWKNFRRKYQDAAGIMRMSKPVTDEGEQIALAYVEFDCGPVCGSGRFLSLTKSPAGEWQVTGGALAWMATE